MRRSLLVILAILQLIAPLVHAHSGASNSPEGVHLPELEVFKTSNSAAYKTATNSPNATEGIIIGISSGIKHNHQQLDSSAKLYISAQLSNCNSEYTIAKINFSPHISVVFSRLFLRSKPPRAPPVELLS